MPRRWTRIDLKGAAQQAVALVTEANGYITTAAPWSLAKAGDDAALDTALGALCRALLRLAVMVAPFMPTKAEALWTALGQPGTPHGAWAHAERPDSMAGAQVVKPENLFPKRRRPQASSLNLPQALWLEAYGLRPPQNFTFGASAAAASAS
jgi:methionyl-tRNA synthetase